jgi:hypothetical protein
LGSVKISLIGVKLNEQNLSPDEAAFTPVGWKATAAHTEQRVLPALLLKN